MKSRGLRRSGRTVFRATQGGGNSRRRVSWLHRAPLIIAVTACAAAGASAKTTFPADPPIPVPKPLAVGVTRALELSPLPEADANYIALGSQPPFSNDVLRGVPPAEERTNNIWRLDVPRLPDMTLAPWLRLNAPTTSNPNDIRIAPPQDQHFDPTPGLDATMDLGDVTLGTKLNQSLKGGGSAPRIGPDGRLTTDSTNVGVDMKMKF